MNFLRFFRSKKTSLSPGSQPPTARQLLTFTLNDPYGRGQSVQASWAEPLGAFVEDAVAAYDFDPRFPSAMMDLFGEETVNGR